MFRFFSGPFFCNVNCIAVSVCFFFVFRLFSSFVHNTIISTTGWMNPPVIYKMYYYALIFTSTGLIHWLHCHTIVVYNLLFESISCCFYLFFVIFFLHYFYFKWQLINYVIYFLQIHNMHCLCTFFNTILAQSGLLIACLHVSR